MTKEKQVFGEGKVVTVDFSIKACPLWLYKEFTKDIKKEFNDVYWVKLHKWYLLSKMLENPSNESVISSEIPQIENEEEREEKEVITFGRDRK